MDIVGRLKNFMDYKGMASSQFADSAQIPRPTLSQILSGRNKKISNEIIGKLHDAFPELNIVWLLFGDGQMVIASHSETSEAQNAPTLFESSDFVPYGQGVSADNDLFDITPRSEPKNYPPMPRRRAQPETADLTSPRAEKPATDRHNAYSKDIGDGYTQRQRAATAAPHQSVDSRRAPLDSRPTTVDFSDTAYPSSQPQQASPQPHTMLSSAQPLHSSSSLSSHEQAPQNNLAGLTAAQFADKTKRIESIMVFYSDKSFDTFYPSDSQENR